MYRLFQHHSIKLVRYFGDQKTIQQSERFCRDRVRLYDHEHFFCGVLLPYQLKQAGKAEKEQIQASYFALRALNIETAFALDQSYHKSRISDGEVALGDPNLPTMDQMAPLSRLWWWRENIQAVFSKRAPTTGSPFTAKLQQQLLSTPPPDEEIREEDSSPKSFQSRHHPILIALEHAIQHFGLSRMWFIRHVESRMRDAELAGNNIRDITELETLVEHSHSSLIYLSLELLYKYGKIDPDAISPTSSSEHSCRSHHSPAEPISIRLHAEHAASHLGKALGLVNLLRSLSVHWRNRRLYLPLQICQHYKVVPEKVFQDAAQGNISSEAQDVVYQIACHAKEHLKHAKELLNVTPSHYQPAFLSAIVVDQVLDKLLTSQFNVFDPSLKARSPFLPLTLWNTARKAKIN